MTPMVDLAFLLLTFFVLTSNLHKPHVTEIVMPKCEGPRMPVDNDYTHTILINGSEDEVYYYSGFMKPEEEFKTLHLSDNSLRAFITEANTGIQTQVAYLNTTFASSRFTQENYDRLEQYVRTATAATDRDPEVVKGLKAECYSNCIGSMDADLKNGTMSEATVKTVGAALRGVDTAPFFIVKWGKDARYADVINVVDELKIGQVSKYAVTEISLVENEALLHHTEKK